MECKYNQDEFCTNVYCPMRGDYCPVPDIDGVCQYEDREEELTPKGCLMTALVNAGVNLDYKTFADVWNIYNELLAKSLFEYLGR